MTGPPEQVVLAFSAQLAVGIGTIVNRNQPEPADLATGEERLILIEGPEEEPHYDPLTGLLLHRMVVGVEGYVAGVLSGTLVNDLLTRVRAAAFSDPTLGGLLWGQRFQHMDFPHFTGMALGKCDRDFIRDRAALPAGAFVQEFILQYATPPEDPATLVRLGEAEG